MTDYRRNHVAGATYFFTVNLFDRRGDLLVRHIDTLREAVRTIRVCAPFHIDAWVVLPDHMHCLWTLPEGDTDFSRRWQVIKTEFSKRMPKTEHRTASRIGKFGNDAFGSIRSATIRIIAGIWTTFTSIR